MRPIPWSEGLLCQEAFDDIPEFIEILAASLSTSEVPFKSIRSEQAHGSAMLGLEILKIGVPGESLSCAGLS